MTPAPRPPDTPPVEATLHPKPTTKPKKAKKERPKRVHANPTDFAIMPPGTHYKSLDQLPFHQSAEMFAEHMWMELRRCEQFYRFAGNVVYVDKTLCQPIIVTPNILRGIIERHVALEAWPKPTGGAGPEPVRQVCSIDQATIVLTHPFLPDSTSAKLVPVLRAVLPHALWHFDRILSGRIKLDNGEFIWTPKRDKSIEPRPIWDMFHDFPMSDASRANFVAGMFTLLIAPVLGGNRPIHITTAPSERSGKSKLHEDVLGCTILGRPITMIQWPEDEAEVVKQMVAMGVGGIGAVCIDNIAAKFDSPGLCSFNTSTSFGARILGKSEFATFLNTMTIFATGNHVEPSAEMLKRALVTEINTGVESPELRTNFKIPDLRGFSLQHRLNHLEYMYQQIEAWVAAGSKPASRPLGGFERWVAYPAGVVEHQLHMPVMGDREARVNEMDRDGADLRNLVEMWWELHKGEGVTATDLLVIAQSSACRAWEGSLAMAKAPLVALSKHLTTYVNRTVGPFKVCRTGSGSRRIYYLKPVAPDAYPEHSPANGG